MPGELTEVTELATAIGTLPGDLATHLTGDTPPVELANVDPATWHRLTDAWRAGRHLGAFLAAHANGAALATAADGLRNRPPQRVEWRGPQRTPGDDTVPADLRIDHVYLVSCKYLSRVLLNAGPPRLFDRLLVGDERSGGNWFSATAPQQFQALYRAAVDELNLPAMPDHVPAMPDNVDDLTRDQQRMLKESLPDRTLPSALIGPWADLCQAVAQESAARWADALTSPRDQLRMLWRLLRIASVTVIGLVTVTALVGSGGYGVFILDGLSRSFTTPIVVGATLSIALAVAVDVALIGVQRLLTPWDRAATNTPPRRVTDGQVAANHTGVNL
jgi:hypothetical protein